MIFVEQILPIDRIPAVLKSSIFYFSDFWFSVLMLSRSQLNPIIVLKIRLSYIYIIIIGTRYTLFNEIFYMEWLNRQVFALVKQWHIVLLLNHGRWRSYSGVSGWGRTAGCGDQRRGNVVAQLAGNFHQNRSHWLWRSTWRRKKSQNRKIDKVLLLLESYEG